MAEPTANGQPRRRGPWVNIAAICRELKQDPVNGPTLVGIHSGSTIGVDRAAQFVNDYRVDVAILLVLELSGGETGREVEIGVDVIGEDGMMDPGQSAAKLRFRGPEGTLRQPITVRIGFWKEQLYWFNVKLNGEVITRVPYRVRYEFLSPDQLGNRP